MFRKSTEISLSDYIVIVPGPTAPFTVAKCTEESRTILKAQKHTKAETYKNLKPMWSHVENRKQTHFEKTQRETKSE